MNQERRVMEPNAEGYQEEWQWCAHKSITTSSLENKIEESWFLVYAFFCDVDCTIVPASYWENITKHRAGKRCAQSALKVGSSQLQHTTVRVWCENHLETVMGSRKTLALALGSVLPGPWESGKIPTWEGWMGSWGLWVVRRSQFSIRAKSWKHWEKSLRI